VASFDFGLVEESIVGGGDGGVFNIA